MVLIAATGRARPGSRRDPTTGAASADRAECWRPLLVAGGCRLSASAARPPRAGGLAGGAHRAVGDGVVVAVAGSSGRCCSPHTGPPAHVAGTCSSGWSRRCCWSRGAGDARAAGAAAAAGPRAGPAAPLPARGGADASRPSPRSSTSAGCGCCTGRTCYAAHCRRRRAPAHAAGRLPVRLLARRPRPGTAPPRARGPRGGAGAAVAAHDVLAKLLYRGAGRAPTRGCSCTTGPRRCTSPCSCCWGRSGGQAGSGSGRGLSEPRPRR